MHKTQIMLSLPEKFERLSGVFWRPNKEFIDELAKYLQGKKVLEIFAGNGLLAGLLNVRGVEVTATSVLSGMDAHASGLYHPVEPIDARMAVTVLGEDHDVLLLCWPTVTEAAVLAARAWGSQKPIIFIGEKTDYSKNHLGGCATDSFFDSVRFESQFQSYIGNCMEIAAVCYFENLIKTKSIDIYGLSWNN